MNRSSSIRKIHAGRLPNRPSYRHLHEVVNINKGSSYPTTVSILTCFGLRNKLKQLQVSRDHHPRLSSFNGDPNAFELSDSHHSSPEHEGSGEKNANRQGESLSSNEILKKLKRYGIAGILSYGLLNTVYYLSAFLLVWFYVAPAPGRMGYLAAAERFLKLMAMVWAGSQVTKLLRAAGALALAPVVDRGLSWFTVKFKFESQGKAFIAIVGSCFGLAFLLFLIVTLLAA